MLLSDNLERTVERPATGLELSKRCPEAADDWPGAGTRENSKMGAAGECHREPIRLRRVF